MLIENSITITNNLEIDSIRLTINSALLRVG